MKMPGLTADAALFKSIGRYRQIGIFASVMDGVEISPQMHLITHCKNDECISIVCDDEGFNCQPLVHTWI